MSGIYEKTEYELTAQNIDVISEKIVAFCEVTGTLKSNATRLRLSAEDCLGIWKTELAEDEKELKVMFESGKRFRKPYIQLSVKGKRCNPYGSRSDNFGTAENSILSSLGLVPVFSYTEDTNTLFFNIERKPKNQLLTLSVVMLSAIAFGVLGMLLCPEELLKNITDSFISTIEDTIFNILSCIAGPMIFLSVAWGGYGIGDVYTLGRIGKKLMLGFLAVVYFFAICGSVTYGIIGNGITYGSLQGSQAGKIFEMLLGIFPENIVSPFLEGNTLQIIFLGFIIGLSLIYLGRKTRSIAVAIEQINVMITFMMKIISRMVPFFVFIVIVRLIWSGNLLVFKDIWKLALVYALAYIGLILVFLVYTAVRNKINPFRLLLQCLPSYMIALSTASSSAAYESNMSIATKKLGVKESMASFSIPFGMVMFKPNTALYYTLLCFYFSLVYSVEVSVSWIIVAIIITGICAVATPPIPGGSAATYTILFLQLGIPTEALAVALAIDMIFDFVMTSGDMLTLLFEIRNVAKRTGMLAD